MSFNTLKKQRASHDTIEHSVETWTPQRRTLQGDPLKSLDEVMIAHLLFLPGLDDVYEQPDEHEIRNAEHRQDVPNFY